jgi:hypothetical protein
MARIGTTLSDVAVAASPPRRTNALEISATLVNACTTVQTWIVLARVERFFTVLSRKFVSADTFVRVQSFIADTTIFTRITLAWLHR